MVCLTSVLGAQLVGGEIRSNSISNIPSGLYQPYIYPWNSQGEAVVGGPGMLAKNGDLTGIAFSITPSGELYFAQKQNDSSSWLWFKVQGTPL